MSEVQDEITVRSLNNGSSYRIRVLNTISVSELPKISINMIHHNNYSNISTINSNKSRVFKSKEPSLKEKTLKSPLLVKISLKSKDQDAVLSYLDQDTYIINYISETFASQLAHNSTNTDDIIKTNPLDDSLVTSWKSSLSKTKLNDFKISMRPPSNITDSPVKDSDAIIDPFDYFMDKYFGTLYQLTTPLTFFTKSTFARLKSLCANSSVDYEYILKQFITEFDKLDARHLVSNNGLLNSEPFFEKESIFRDKFISKSFNFLDMDVHSSNFSQTNKSLSSVLNIFKIREIQLQILILLELLSHTGSDDLSQLKQKPKKKRKGLIGKRKLMPVINGGAVVPDMSTKVPLTYIQHYDGLVDRMVIWETLNVASSSFSSSVLTSNTSAAASSTTSVTDYSSKKFITHVIIPFFDKKCPNNVKHLIKKVKGPSFRATTTSKEERKKKASLKRSASELSSESSSTSTNIQQERKVSKLEDLKDIKLSRSNSDIQQLTRNSSFNASNLSRRQVDISKPSTSSSTSIKLVKRSTSTSVFNRAGKKGSMSAEQSKPPPPQPSNIPFSQVEETPVKKQRHLNFITTPQDPKSHQMEVSSIIRQPNMTIDSVKSDNTIMSSVRSTHRTVPVMNDVIMSSVEKSPKDIDFLNNENSSTAQQPILQSPLAFRSSVSAAKRQSRPGDPFDFDNDDSVMNSPLFKTTASRLSASKVKRKLFAPTK